MNKRLCLRQCRAGCSHRRIAPVLRNSSTAEGGLVYVVMELNEHTNLIEMKAYAFEFTLIQTIENSQPRTNNWADKVSCSYRYPSAVQ